MKEKVSTHNSCVFIIPLI